MKPSQKGIDLIKEFEGLRLQAYLDPIGIPTIGYGTIRYDDGRKVQMGDVITKDRAIQLLTDHVSEFSCGVHELIIPHLNQNQFDALVSFAYNLGLGNLKKSTLRKKVNINPSDPTIHAEFLKWNKAGGRVLVGLTKRRQREADLYFS